MSENIEKVKNIIPERPPLTEEERLQIIAEQHWVYTERVIMLLLQETKNLYIDAFKHGCKHGKEGRY